jgi:hypothetical protein
VRIPSTTHHSFLSLSWPKRVRTGGSPPDDLFGALFFWGLRDTRSTIRCPKRGLWIQVFGSVFSHELFCYAPSTLLV